MFIPGKDDAVYYISLALEPVDFSRYETVVKYVLPPQKPKVFGGYRSIPKHVFKTRLPMPYVQNVKCELNSKLDGEDK